ncbi:MAG: EF-hand domain-containing protein [Betaproteobacteria bacterium]
MTPSRVTCLAGAIAVATAFVAAAQTSAPMLDPWVPPALRKAAPRPPVEGAELKAQVERKLRASFDAADVAGAGSLTRAQAQAAGLGYVAKNFERIDAAGTGRVTFDDLKRYLRAQGADL